MPTLLYIYISVIVFITYKFLGNCKLTAINISY